MPYAEFVEQIAYYQFAPWGDDWNQAQAVAAAAISASTKFKRVELGRFFPKPRRAKSDQQPADYIFGVFRQMAIDSEARRKLSSGK